MRVLRARMIDCQWQEWSSRTESSNRFELFRQINLNHSIPVYLSMNIDKHLKFIMTRFRFGVSDILIHSYRYRRHVENDLICPLCKCTTENETHFVFTCPLFDDMRSQLIPRKFYRQPSLFRLIMLMTSTNEQIVKRFAIFLYKAFKIRTILCS